MLTTRGFVPARSSTANACATCKDATALTRSTSMMRLASSSACPSGPSVCASPD